MSDSKDILIFGGTGKIGQNITQAILDARPSFDKVAIFTSPSTVENKKEQLEKWKGQGLKIIVGDLTKEDDVLKAYEGASKTLKYYFVRLGDFRYRIRYNHQRGRQKCHC